MSTLIEPGFTRESRIRNLDRLRRESFDVLILGGGINGAGIARDLALRGLKVALVEQRHFASGTSGKNSQLIHGGLRYLKQLEFRLVRESLSERATLLRLAPHLVTPQPFLMPLYGWTLRWFYGAGLWMYDLLAGSANIGRHRVLSRKSVEGVEPGLARQGLTHGAVFFDCQINSARFVLENIWDASRLGAAVVNYARAERQGERVTVTDVISGGSISIRAEKLVDSTGAWASEEMLRLVRGSHLVFPRLNASENAIAYFDKSGRIIFVIPWGSLRQLSLVGTTDVDHDGTPDDVRISPGEREYLLDTVQRLFPEAKHIEPISTFSSLRPLVRSHTQSATRTSREHRIWMDADGVVHVAGGKYTTYRAMSEEAANLISEVPSTTAHTSLGGNTRECIDDLMSSVARFAAQYKITPEEAALTVRHYGAQTARVLDYLPAQPGAALSRLECAQIRFAVEHEMAEKLTDVMFVSTYWGYERRWSEQTLLPFAAEMGRQIGWTDQRVGAEILSMPR